MDSREVNESPAAGLRFRRAAQNLALGGVGASALLTLLRFFDFDQLLLLGVVAVAPALLVVSVLVWAALAGIRTFVASVIVLGAAVLLALPGTVLPRTGCDVTRGAEDDIVVFSHNLLVGNPDLTAILEQIDRVDADVLLLQETTPDAFAVLVDVLGAAYPHRESVGLQHVFSTVPLSDRFVTGTSTGGSLVVTAEFEGAPLRIANVHPSAPLSGERRVNQREEYVAMRQWRADQEVAVLMGDFNAGAPQPIYRDVVSDGYVDAHRAAGCGTGLSWSRSRGGGQLLLSLDHALVAEEAFQVIGFEVLDYAGSDHKAIALRVRSTP